MQGLRKRRLWRKQTLSALMASVRGCWQCVFSETQNDRTEAVGLKTGVRGGQVDGFGAKRGGDSKHLPTLQRRWKNLSSHSLIDGCLRFFTDLEGINLELWWGRILKRKMIFLTWWKGGHSLLPHVICILVFLETYLDRIWNVMVDFYIDK